MNYELHLGDCLEVLPTLAAGSVDLIATDLPYGTTACSWDTIIPFAPMWEQVKRVLKPNGVFLTTASQPFTSALVMSNPKWFKYEWIWEKTMGTNPMTLKYQPFKNHENILVFSSGGETYNPQMTTGKAYKDKPRAFNLRATVGEGLKSAIVNIGTRYPFSVQKFPNPNNDNRHPTQKPVDLYRYFIRTYSNPGELVLDFTAGSGTTGVAALLENRRFIGIELMQEYYEIAKARLDDTARLMRKEYKPLKDNGASLEGLPLFQAVQP